MTNRQAIAAFAQLLLSGTLIHEGEFYEVQKEYGVTIHPTVSMAVSVDRYPNLAAEHPASWRTEIARVLVDTIVTTLQAFELPHLWLWTEEGVMALFIDTSIVKSAAPEAVEAKESVVSTDPLLAVARSMQTNLAGAGVSVSIGIGSTYEDPNLLHKSFHEAMQALSGRFFQGNQLIFAYNADDEADEGWSDELTDEKTELLALLRMGDERGTVHTLKLLFDKMAIACTYNEKLFRSEAIDLVMLMARSVFESGIRAVEVLTDNARVIHDLYGVIRYDNFVKKACDYAKWLTTQVDESEVPTASPLIRDAIKFMKENHRTRVSLDDVARHCCLSKYHLSHLFKREVGVGVIDFLNQIRIDKAVFYLNTSDLPVQQIASQVGYEDANYFSRLFRQRTGSSPSEYRIARLC